MNIVCTDITCKWNNECKCKRKDLHLTHGVTTIKFNERLRYLKCANYRETEEYKRIKKALKKIELNKELLKGEQS